VRQFYFPIFPLARFLVESEGGESTFRIQGASFGKRASEPDPGNTDTEYRMDFRHCAPSLCPTSAKEIWFCSNGCHWPRPVGGDAGAEPRHSLRACRARPSAGFVIRAGMALRGEPGDNAKGDFLGGTHSVRPPGKAVRMPRHFIPTRCVAERARPSGICLGEAGALIAGVQSRPSAERPSGDKEACLASPGIA
jgi:hypothetical protein